MSLSKKLRFEVMKRDAFMCGYCGKSAPHVVLEVDHVVPRASGGSDDPDNLVTACFDCNRGKGATPLGNPVPGEMPTKVKEIYSAAAAAQQRREAVEWACGELREWLLRAGLSDEMIPENSLRTFIRKLPMDQLCDAVETLEVWWNRNQWRRQADAWRYFCGICWRTIKGQSDAA